MNWLASGARASAPLCPPVADQWRLVGRVIVHDEMNVQIVRDGGFDLIEKLAELCGAMASIALADDPAGCDVEGRKERCGAMPRVIVAASSRLTGPHRKHGLAAVECLDLGLLVHTQDQ